MIEWAYRFSPRIYMPIEVSSESPTSMLVTVAALIDASPLHASKVGELRKHVEEELMRRMSEPAARSSTPALSPLGQMLVPLTRRMLRPAKGKAVSSAELVAAVRSEIRCCTVREIERALPAVMREVFGAGISCDVVSPRGTRVRGYRGVTRRATP